MSCEYAARSRKLKEQTLGMAFSTARSRLFKSLIFDLLQKDNKNVCFRCGKIITIDDFSVDHVIDWLYKDQAEAIKLFFDLDNIRFSHNKCNTKAARCAHNVTSKSGFKGVGVFSNVNRTKGFYAAICPNGKSVYLGSFKTAEEAAKVYDEAASKTFGERAVTNKMLGLL